jgi:peptidylprolyl isomerase
MTNKTPIIILIIIAATLPWSLNYFTNNLELTSVTSSKTDKFISPPADATMLKPGLSFIILKKGNVEGDSEIETIVRSKSIVWVDGGEQSNNDDALEATDPIDLEVSHPFLSEILRASSTGGHYLWWVDSSLISEDTSGFEAKNTMIDIKIVDRVAPMPAPSDVAEIPEYAAVGEAGVGFYLLSEPTLGAHPTLEDDVEVHYSGWQTDGKMFDSSVLREKTNTFPLGRLIEGWQKAVPLMRVGEKARIWIPGDLAYDLRENRPYAPKGMLVFDVELVSIPPKVEDKLEE